MVALATPIALAVALVGCTTEAPASQEPRDSVEGARLGISVQRLDTPFNSVMNSALEQGSEELGFDVMQITSADGDVGQQISDLQTLISGGAEGLVIQPVDSDAIVPALENAQRNGVPVVTVDTAANSEDVYINVRADNVSMGGVACEAMGDALGGSGRVLELQGDLATSSGRDRDEGFATCMSEQFPDIEVIQKEVGWNADEGASVAETILSTEEIDGVFLPSDEVFLTPVLTAMKRLDKLVPVGEDGHITIVTIDGGSTALDAIRDGSVDAVVSQPITDYGSLAARYIKEALEGVEIELGPTDHDSEIVEYEGSYQDLLPSPLVTIDNVDDSSLWGNG